MEQLCAVSHMQQDSAAGRPLLASKEHLGKITCLRVDATEMYFQILITEAILFLKELSDNVFFKKYSSTGYSFSKVHAEKSMGADSSSAAFIHSPKP